MKPLLFVLAIIPSFAIAQDATILELKKDANIEVKKDPNDTAARTWKTGGTFNLNVNQGTLSNWSAGGDKFSFSMNAYLNLFAFYKKDKHAWDNVLDLAIGVVQTTSLGRRKSSDRIDLTSKYGFFINKKLNMTSLFNLRSQFANGYKYTKNSAGNDSASLTSRSFQPTMILFSQGFDIRPVKNLSLFLSPLTAKWIIVGNSDIKNLYGVSPDKMARYEVGAFLSANYSTPFAKNITYKTKLDLFSNYKSNPENIDIFWTNAITAKITRYINFTFNVDMIYDDNTKNIEPGKGPAPQWLQLMGIGFAYKFGNGKTK